MVLCSTVFVSAWWVQLHVTECTDMLVDTHALQLYVLACMSPADSILEIGNNSQITQNALLLARQCHTAPRIIHGGGGSWHHVLSSGLLFDTALFAPSNLYNMDTYTQQNANAFVLTTITRALKQGGSMHVWGVMSRTEQAQWASTTLTNPNMELLSITTIPTTSAFPMLHHFIHMAHTAATHADTPPQIMGCVNRRLMHLHGDAQLVLLSFRKVQSSLGVYMGY